MSVLSLALVTAVTACGPDSGTPLTKSDDTTTPPDQRQNVRTEEGPIGPFDSEAAFDAYMASLETFQSAPDGGGNNNVNNASESDSGATAEPDNENITNNQEEGVDEGGIVKNVGDYLLVLRRGRLFSVAVAEAGQARQTDSIRVASDEGINSNVWYDEMLVDGDDVFVIGYRYLANVVDDRGDRVSHIYGATEINTFELQDNGTIERRDVSFIQSNDYYAWDNSATRMVDGRIIYYMPYGVFFQDPDQRNVRVPQKLEHIGDGTFRTAGDLFTWKDVVRPASAPMNPTFHTVVSCDVSTDTMDCGARSLLGDWWREVYVSPSHVFLWAGERVYAMSQDLNDVSAHAVRGVPPSRFAFKQAGDTLHVGVQNYTPTSTPSQPDAHIEMLSLPLDDFDDVGKQRLDNKAKLLKEINGSAWMWKNRHVDGWWLSGLDRTQNQQTEHIILAHRLGTDIVEELPLDSVSWSSRIEAMPGVGALFVESASTGLKLHTIKLEADRAQLLANPEEIADVQEGESRSHGFFFKPSDDGGTFGLPIINGGYGNGWGFGVSNIAFFDAAGTGEVEMRGVVSSTPAAEGGCETSCIDWYGNTRPIFLRDRIYALMGSEIQELELDDNGVTELGSRVELSF